MMGTLILILQGVLMFDVLGWEVRMPKAIHGLRGSCLVIPCSFSYTSNPPKNPRRIVWYQWVSRGYPLVYDPWYPADVIEKFRWKTDLYRSSDWKCSLLIKNLEQSHHGEKVYAWIDPENVGWRTYAFYDVTSTIYVDDHSQNPTIYIYGGERMGETISATCSTSHTCPYSKPTITLNGIEGSDQIDNGCETNGQCRTTLTRKGVIKSESLTITCSVTHYGGRTVNATMDKSAQCVHHNIKIEPELADLTEGIAKNFNCSVYHSCQRETPTITWNYENMQVSTGSKTLSGFNRVTYSNITFLSAIEDHGKKLICTATFSGGNIVASVVLHVQKYLKPDPIRNETYFQYMADMTPKITALTRSCVMIPCSFQVGEEYVTRLWVRWVTKKGDYMFHTSQLKVLDNFRDRTKLLGNPDEQNCTLEMDDVKTHDNGPFCFQAEKENEKYSFNNSCVFIIMRASPDKPVMSSLPEDIEPGTRVTIKCSVNHTCSSHPPEITWSVPTSKKTVSHSPMGEGVWETESTVIFSPTGYEDKDNIVCSVKFWGGKTQETKAFLSVKKVQGIGFGPYVIAASLVFILICILAGVFIHKRRQGQPRQNIIESEPRRSVWNRFSSRFSMSDGRAPWINRGNRSDSRFPENAPDRPPRQRHQSPRNNANMRAEYKANNVCTVSGNKPVSKPHMPSPKSEPKSCHGYGYDYDDDHSLYGNV